jgi:hypothetical protein
MCQPYGDAIIFSLLAQSKKIASLVDAERWEVRDVVRVAVSQPTKHIICDLSFF